MKRTPSTHTNNSNHNTNKLKIYGWEKLHKKNTVRERSHTRTSTAAAATTGAYSQMNTFRNGRHTTGNSGN